MKQLLLFFWLILKKQLKNPAFCIFLLLIPLSVLAASKFPAFSDSAELQIGLYAPDSDTVTFQTMEQLLKTDKTVSYLLYTDYELLKKDVATGQLACAYVFPQNLTGLLDSGKYKNAVTVLAGQNADFISTFSNELVFSALLKVYGNNLLKNYMASSSYFAGAPEQVRNEIDASYSAYLEDSGLFHVEFNTLSDGQSFDNLVEIEETTSLFPLRGILSILIFAAGLFGSLQYLRIKSNGTFCAMPLACRIGAPLFYPWILSLLTGVSCMAALLVHDNSLNITTELVSVLSYTALICVYCAVLSLLFRRETLLAAALPVLLILCLVICPVFVNVTPFIPGINYLRWLLPPMYYLG